MCLKMQRCPFRLYIVKHQNEGKWIHNKRKTTCCVMQRHIVYPDRGISENVQRITTKHKRILYIIMRASHILNSLKECTHTNTLLLLYAYAYANTFHFERERNSGRFILFGSKTSPTGHSMYTTHRKPHTTTGHIHIFMHFSCWMEWNES